MTRTIALMTDFGLADAYVGVMKGVMRGICPQADFIDLTHAIEPQNVRRAAFALANLYTFFPVGTIFLVVVDPGVGGTRRPIAVRTEDYMFVGPDNGVFSYLLANQKEYLTVALTNRRFHLDNISYTFHGRDVFAPVAAHLAEGVSITEMGDPLPEIIRLPPPQLHVEGRKIHGEIVDIDHFGNIITSIGYLHWNAPGRLTLIPSFGNTENSVRLLAEDTIITLQGSAIMGIKTAYSEATRGEPLMLVGSGGYLEIAVNQGNAAHRFDAGVGDPIALEIGAENATVRH